MKIQRTHQVHPLWMGFGMCFFNLLGACSAQISNGTAVTFPQVATSDTSNLLVVDPSILAVNYVDTSEVNHNSQLGGSVIEDLATPDAVSFYLGHASTIYVDYHAQSAAFYGATTMTNVIQLDGVLVPQSAEIIQGLGDWNPVGIAYPISISEGFHTIHVLHATTNSVDAFWSNRLLVVRELTSPFMAVNTVLSTESTASTSWVDLPTLDQVSFNLNSAQPLLLEYGAMDNSPSSGAFNFFTRFNIDDISDSSQIIFSTWMQPGASALHSMSSIQNFSAGSHSLKVQHEIDQATGSWSNRVLRVTSLASPFLFTSYHAAPESVMSTLATASPAPQVFTDLSTLDEVSFSVPQATNVLVEYTASATCAQGYNEVQSEIVVDGVPQTVSNSQISVGNATEPVFANMEISVTAGTHDIKIQHAQTYFGWSMSGVCTLTGRLLKATLVN